MVWSDARAMLRLSGPKIAVVGLMAGTKILTGKRNDNNRWTFPGGHIDEGESLLAGACREVFEETAIEIGPEELHLLACIRRSGRNGKDFSVFTFLAGIPMQETSSKNDPDNEVNEWVWVEADWSSVELRPEMRHAVHDDICCHLGLCPCPKSGSFKGRIAR